MAAVPTLVDQAIALMTEGVRTGNVPPKVLMERVPAQIAAQIVEEPAQSPFYRPFTKFPDAVPEADRKALAADAQRTISEKIVPAYRKLQAYFSDEYLPHARAGIAITDLPDGADYYTYLAGYYTTTDLTPAQIHDIGLEEVARIRAEMEKLKAQTGFEGTLAEFFTYLSTDPKFFEKTPEALLERYRAVAKRIEPELVRVFHTIPRLPYGVRAIPANVAPATPTASHIPGAAHGPRPVSHYVTPPTPHTHPPRDLTPTHRHHPGPARRRRRLTAWLLLRQPVQARDPADLGDDPAGPERGGAGPSFPVRPRAGDAGRADVPPHGLFRRLRRGLEPVRRAPGLRHGPVRRSLRPHGPAGLRHVARGAAGGRHRHAQPGLEPRAGDRVLHGQLAQDPPGRGQRDRPLHRHAGAGAGLQDRPAQDLRTP